MRKYKCQYGCDLPIIRKEIRELSEGVYGYEYYDFPFCPNCGALMPSARDRLENFFKVYNIHPKLEKSKQQLLKSEFDSAVREAAIAVETSLKVKSGLDSHGFDLATRALSFEFDKTTSNIKKTPLIAINNLKTESERNEQDGLRYMLMGYFQGVRNIYQHNSVGAGVSNAISAVIQASFFLDILDGNSLTKHGEWILTKRNYKYIYDHMPKKIDRIRLRYRLKRLIKQHSKTRE